MRAVLVVIAFAALALASDAAAWTWPVDGPVLQRFDLGADPYAAGRHRGVDIGGVAAGPVAVPASGTVSFAGTVPTSGRSLTIETADGYPVTLTHLGTIGVRRGDIVAEGVTVGTVGPTGVVEHETPYVHLGIRRTDDPQGYVDPLLFLPDRPPAAAPAVPAASTAVAPGL